MSKNKTPFIVMIGNKAQNGKDTLANFIKEIHPSTVILHWADHLYKECYNSEREHPLVKTEYTGTGIIYALFDKKVPGGVEYNLFYPDQVPALHKIMEERDLDAYWGMNNKDGQMLQFWGTDYRRQKCDDLYWVNKTRADYVRVAAEYEGDEPLIIPIADNRYRNEWAMGKTDDGIYARVTRLNLDGTQYLAQDGRDNNHISETDMDGIEGDIMVTAYEGDFDALRQAAKEIVALSYTDSPILLTGFSGIDMVAVINN